MLSKFVEPFRTSAAWRFAMPGVAVVAIGSAAVMLIGFELLSASIRSRGDAWLEAEVASIAGDVEVTGASPTAIELDTEVHELVLHEGLKAPAEELEDDGLFFLVLLSPGGRVVSAASRGPGAALEQTLAAIPPPARGMTWIHPAGLEYPVRVVTCQLSDGRRVVGGATPYADAELLEEVRDVAVVGWVMMLAVAAPVTWMAVRRGLRRVDHLTEVAASISADELTRRLPERGGDDEIDRLAATFNALLERAARASAQLRTVADTIAHDLRTPLARLRGRLEEALGDGDPEFRQAAIEAAIAELDGASAMIEAGLESAEAEGGTLRVRRAPLDLGSLIRDLLELYAPAAADSRIELAYQGDADVPIVADHALLQRALINLLDNAVAHLPPDTRVTVSATRDDSGASFAVADDGPGFPAEIADRAFERSVRGPSSSGRGLGLALVRAVAVAHGGCAVLERPARGGSVVRVELPGA